MNPDFPFINETGLTKLTQPERDQAIIGLLERLASGNYTIANKNTERWETGWSENLELLKDTGEIEASLKPKYYRPNQPIRYMGDLWMPDSDPDFEYNWFCKFRAWVIKTYLKDYKNIFEFGCGSGFNVAYMAQTYPDKNITGLDWAYSSVEICERLRYDHGLNIMGRRFDFFNPDDSLYVPAGSALFTSGALEQTGTNGWKDFMNYVRQKEFDICVHIEPIVEFYKPEVSILDYVTVKIHEARDFWRGFPAYLRDLKEHGAVEIITSERAILGSIMIEGYSLIVWKPL